MPALGNVEDLIKLFALYGTIEEYVNPSPHNVSLSLTITNRYRLLDEEEAAQFTDVYWVRFENISAARIAKRKCDDYNFIGNLLDVAYAPQFESVSDMKAKLEERRRVVARKIAQSMKKAEELRS